VRRYASRIYDMTCVCLSFRPSQAGIVPNGTGSISPTADWIYLTLN